MCMSDAGEASWGEDLLSDANGVLEELIDAA